MNDTSMKPGCLSQLFIAAYMRSEQSISPAHKQAPPFSFTQFEAPNVLNLVTILLLCSQGQPVTHYAKSRLLTLASKASLIEPPPVTGLITSLLSLLPRPSHLSHDLRSTLDLLQAFLFIQMSPSQRWPFLNTLSKTVPHPYPFNVVVSITASHFLIMKALVFLLFTCLSILYIDRQEIIHTYISFLPNPLNNNYSI